MYTKTSTYEIKEATPRGEVAGIAWDFAATPDADGDFIMPSAFRRSGSPPQMLVEHKGESIGQWQDVAVSDDGVAVSGQINVSSKSGREAAARAADGDLRALSLGFGGQFEKSGRHRIFSDIEVQEISLVRNPANRGARVTAFKSLNECDSIAEFEKTLKHRLDISRRQARVIANTAWPIFNEEDPGDIVGILKSFSLR